jgi:hypothetical protein
VKRTSLPFRAERLDDVVVTAFGDPPGGRELLGPEHARRVVREAWTRAESRRRLMSAFVDDRGLRHGFASSDLEDEVWLPHILRAIEEGRLLLWRTERTGVDGGDWGDDVDDPTLSGPALGTTWIELQLVDDRGSAVPHEAYEITTPEGQHRSGRLDERGMARLDQLQAGSCQITFPRIDGREWGRTIPVPALPGDDATSHLHTVRQGEDATTIALLYGFRHWQTVWAHPPNGQLRSKRSPEQLFPGDEIAIPARLERREEGPTTQRHKFVVRTSSRRLQIVLLDHDRTPLRDDAYTLWLNDAPIAEDTTDADGKLDHAIPLSASQLVLECSIGNFTLNVGALNPLDDVPDRGVSGAQARLNNLGFDAGPADGELGPRTADALRRFQHLHGLPPHGELDARTKAALKQAHGS